MIHDEEYNYDGLFEYISTVFPEKLKSNHKSRYFEILQLRFQDKLTFSEISKELMNYQTGELGVSETAVSQLYNKAMRILRSNSTLRTVK